MSRGQSNGARQVHHLRRARRLRQSRPKWRGSLRSCAQRDVEVVTTREPGGTDIGERIRAVLLDSRTAGLDAHAEMALMFASRAQLIAEVIAPALEAGHWVLCDRFTDSTEAYQGAGRQLGTDAVLRLHEVLCRGLWPDLTILMDCDVSSSVGRARRRNQAAARRRRRTRTASKKKAMLSLRGCATRFWRSPSASRSGWSWWTRDRRLEVVHPEIVRTVFERLMGGRGL